MIHTPTPELIATAIFPPLLDWRQRKVRGTTLKLALLAVWATKGQPVPCRTVADYSGISLSQTWRALRTLAQHGIITARVVRKAGRRRNAPRGTYTINHARLAEVAHRARKLEAA